MDFRDMTGRLAFAKKQLRKDLENEIKSLDARMLDSTLFESILKVSRQSAEGESLATIDNLILDNQKNIRKFGEMIAVDIKKIEMIDSVEYVKPNEPATEQSPA